MFKGICICSTILLIVFGLAVAPALGVKVVVNTKETTATTKCNLGDSTKFSENTLGGYGGVYQNAEISGIGENSVEKKASGDGYGVMSSFDASGTVNSQISAMASGNGAIINTQTGISGGSGCISTSSDTETNNMEARVGFSGEGGQVTGGFISAAYDGERAFTGGYGSMNGVEYIDEQVSMGIAHSKDIALSTNGIYVASDGKLGDFGMLIMNTEKEYTSNGKGGSQPAKPPSGANEYKLTGYKLESEAMIEIDDTTIPLYLGESSTRFDSVQSRISSAAEEWDGTTEDDIFYVADYPYGFEEYEGKYDGRYVHSWTDSEDIVGNSESSTIAVTQTWYSLGRNKNVLDSDCYYSLHYTWYMADPAAADLGYDEDNLNIIDLQTIALHELGHTAGLADLYTDSTKEQVMHGWHYKGEVDWSLGDGDIAGMQKLYG